MFSNPGKEFAYRTTIEEEARAGVRTLAILAFCLFPVFSLLDFFTQRDHYLILSLNRFSAAFFFFVVHLLFRRGVGLKKPVVAGNVLLAVASLSITLMCVSLTGSESPYYAGVNLVVLAGVLILPTDGVSMLKTVCLIIGIYVAGIVLTDEGQVISPGLVNNLFFLCSTGIIGVTAAHLKQKLRRDSFEKMNDLAIRDSFISIASHEFRTPLTSMKLQLDVANMKLASDRDERDGALRSIGNAYRQISNLLRLVEELLDVSRIQSGKFFLERAPIDLNVLVRQTIERNYGELLGEGKLSLSLHPQALPGMWDAFKLEQVIINLVNNAFKYGEGTVVRVETMGDEDYAAVSVTDHGCGVRPEDQARIFEKFERGKSARSGGLGLGLYISNEIVAAHSGDITLRSLPGEGTVFTVRLPVRRDEARIP